MGSRRRRSVPYNTREISRDMLHEILVKLPTKDVARCRCVSRLWRSVASDPSFLALHAMATHVTSARTEALLVTVSREPGRSDEASAFNVSSSRKAMCCDAPVPGGYGLANVCNGFLCFVHHDGPEAPALVCNPVTGETAALPRAPPLMITSERQIRHLFAMGFSPSTKEHKVFRLSYPYPRWFPSSEQRVEVDVYTLGDARGWRRRRSFVSPCCPSRFSAPVSIDDKLYLVTVSWTHYSKHEIPKRVLAIDVAAESCCTYSLPDYETWPYDQPTVGAFDLNGRLCFAAHIINLTEFMTINFWVMSLPPEDKGGHQQQQPSWDLRYSFHMEGHPFYFSMPWSCWLDDDENLCYLMMDILHKYNTKKVPSVSNAGFLQWDNKLQLPKAPTLSKCRWNVYGGYRPTLLSPLTFPLAPSQDGGENKHQFEHALLSLLSCHQ